MQTVMEGNNGPTRSQSDVRQSRQEVTRQISKGSNTILHNVERSEVYARYLRLSGDIEMPVHQLNLDLLLLAYTDASPARLCDLCHAHQLPLRCRHRPSHPRVAFVCGRRQRKPVDLLGNGAVRLRLHLHPTRALFTPAAVRASRIPCATSSLPPPSFVSFIRTYPSSVDVRLRRSGELCYLHYFRC